MSVDLRDLLSWNDNLEKLQLHTVFQFLDELRASSQVNMMMASPYVQSEYGLEGRVAGACLRAWQSTFALGGTPESRAAHALSQPS